MTTTFELDFDEFQPLSAFVRRVDFFMGQALQHAENLTETVPPLPFDFAATDQPPTVYAHPAVLSFAQAFQLNEFELDVIALALAPELDLRYGATYAYLQADPVCTYPTVDFALKMLGGDGGDRLQRRHHFSDDAPLIAQHIIQLVPPPNSIKPSLISHFLVLDEQLMRLLFQQSGLDQRLKNLCELHTPRGKTLQTSLCTPLQRNLPLFISAHCDQNLPLRLYLQGKRPETYFDTALEIASALDMGLLEVQISALLTLQDHGCGLVPFIFREAWFQNALVYFEGIDLLWRDDYQRVNRQLQGAIARHQGIVIFSGQHPWQPSMRETLGVISFPVEPPSNEQRQQYWRQALTAAEISIPTIQLAQLSDRYGLTPNQISNAVAIAQKKLQWHDFTATNIDPFQELCAAARLQSGHSLITLAKKIEPQYTWADIVLPSPILTQLQGICQEAEYRDLVHEQWGFSEKLSLGKGLNILFAGAPGTGKTMTAEAIANHLQLDLYKIDLSQIISKYIGETEKNLRKIFTAAADTNAILLFDEADALFGKRSEIQDAHDRYANIEVGFLLQQMEEYEGITILTTNLRSNMDTAFERRLRFIVEFPKPDVGDRLKIWQQTFPTIAPVSPDIDWQFLAKQFDLTGANIKNIALTAAFHAADTHTEITMAAIIFALKREYQKMGQILRDKELGNYSRSRQD
ncbi:ATP-binding protein [[Limnothrix rosea] IAM M-220]|uniref:ATP-binding protein n=1 Tax=[Limnothrix rosea] IAM M-220 TaxID=454133 RepID=UPI000964870B|nr:ATP-binding protein [[Limnothrix rosea] IAM M-220]OKH15168.1 hypothetical protein NIES208_12885 [[Limnothrix rosea] IAM M-220]